MSFLPLGGRTTGQQSINRQNIAIAERELDNVMSMAQCVMDSCYRKCVPPKYYEGDLNKGESVCIDRCVAKFWDVQMKITKMMAQKQQQTMAAGGVGAFGGGFS